MKIIKPIGLALLLLMETLTGTTGQPTRTDFNPAPLYYQAFLATPDLVPNDRAYLFANEGFVVRSAEADGKKHLVLLGGSPKATLYGVYHYLESVCGVGFFGDGEYIPSVKSQPHYRFGFSGCTQR
jgi:hypothetical protein